MGGIKRMNNLRIILERTFRSLFLLAFISVFSFLNQGCYKPVAAHSLTTEISPSQELFEVAPIDIDRPIDALTELSLRRYGPTIQKYSERYDLDWRLVLAVMKRESMFRPTAISNRGAFGLMQIMPTTQSELVEKLGIDEAVTPYNNIKAGIYHLRSLYRVFSGSDHENRLRLTLAAYNAGLTRILDAQDIAAYLGEDPNEWQAVKSALPMLSKRHYTLHHKIWDSAKPRAGFFRDWKQTIGYVESIMDYYDEYRLALH